MGASFSIEKMTSFEKLLNEKNITEYDFSTWYKKHGLINEEKLHVLYLCLINPNCTVANFPDIFKALVLANITSYTLNAYTKALGTQPPIPPPLTNMVSQIEKFAIFMRTKDGYESRSSLFSDYFISLENNDLFEKLHDTNDGRILIGFLHIVIKYFSASSRDNTRAFINNYIKKYITHPRKLLICNDNPKLFVDLMLGKLKSSDIISSDLPVQFKSYIANIADHREYLIDTLCITKKVFHCLFDECNSLEEPKKYQTVMMLINMYIEKFLFDARTSMLREDTEFKDVVLLFITTLPYDEFLKVYEKILGSFSRHTINTQAFSNDVIVPILQILIQNKNTDAVIKYIVNRHRTRNTDKRFIDLMMEFVRDLPHDKIVMIHLFLIDDCNNYEMTRLIICKFMQNNNSSDVINYVIRKNKLDPPVIQLILSHNWNESVLTEIYNKIYNKDPNSGEHCKVYAIAALSTAIINKYYNLIKTIIKAVMKHNLYVYISNVYDVINAHFDISVVDLFVKYDFKYKPKMHLSSENFAIWQQYVSPAENYSTYEGEEGVVV